MAKKTTKKKAEAAEAPTKERGEMSSKELLDNYDDPVLVKPQIIHHSAAPVVEKHGPPPNIELKTEVIWGPLPKDPPPKPDRRAATVETHVMERPGDPGRKSRSIGSMQPYFGKK